jgi:thymidylate synthase
MHLTCRNVNEAFHVLVESIHEGWIPTEVEASRYGEVIRMPEPVIVTYTHPTERVLFNAARDANPFFSVYESLYFLAGRNDVAPLAYYNSRMPEFSDDSKTFNDSYGYRWRQAPGKDEKYGQGTVHTYHDQLDILVDHLRSKPESRRAVLQMWNLEDDLLKVDGVPCADCIERNKRMFFTDPGPCKRCGSLHKQVGTVPSKAVCCNLSAVFRVEWGRCPDCDGTGKQVIDTGGFTQWDEPVSDVVPCPHCKGTPNDAPEFLNITVFNRSNDLIYGMLGANAVHFSFLLEYMAAHLGLKVGKYHQVTADLHAYTKTWKPEKWLADKTSDYYTDARVETSQDWGVDFSHQVPLVKYPLRFDYECSQLVQYHSNGESFGMLGAYRWEEPFLQTVAEPMFRAYHAYKFKSYDSALRWANLVAAPDWRVAARGWIQRRLERKGVSI